MKTLGFVGTAKNAGKTTTALHMLDLVNSAGIHTALTSIGYDGENVDHITGLPKPRYIVSKGMMIATACGCLGIGSAEYKALLPTGLKTILGEIVIAEVSKPGFVVLAGPNRRKDLKALLDQLKGLGIELAMVDGALNRLAALTAADGMLLSTGAAFDEHIPALAEHAAALESLFHFPRRGDYSAGAPDVVSYTDSSGDAWQLQSGSLLDEETLRLLADRLAPGGRGACWIPGVFAPRLFQQLLEEGGDRLAGKEFVFASPLNLLASGSPLLWQASFERLGQLGGQAAYAEPMPLHFITVNPFYPRYLQQTGRYIAAYVDKVELLEAVRAAVTASPVVDILQPPHPNLLALCGLE